MNISFEHEVEVNKVKQTATIIVPGLLGRKIRVELTRDQIEDFMKEVNDVLKELDS